MPVNICVSDVIQLPVTESGLQHPLHCDEKLQTVQVKSNTDDSPANGAFLQCVALEQG